LNFDKLTYAGNLDNLKDIETDPRYKFYKGDIGDAKAVEAAISLMDGVDAIVNFAAETHVDRSILASDDFLKTNVLGLNLLLKLALKHRIKKFIQISTDEVYGSINKGKFKEADIIAPSSPYSSSKAAGDILALSYFKTYKLPVVITRSSNNFGPYQYPEKIIPLFITNALENRHLPLYGDGLNIRDWIFVEDNCRGIDLVLRKGLIGEVYNIGGSCEKTNKELTDLILHLTGKPKSLIKRVEDRPGHDRRYALDTTKIRKLGWRQKYDFIEALKLTIDWYIRNEMWWERLKDKSAFKAHYKKWYRRNN
jgi:dTDP-glucose 4,6-dehydratase